MYKANSRTTNVTGGDLFTRGVCFGVALTFPFYVAGYFPPAKQGEMKPPHEHIEQSTGNAPTTNSATVTAISSGYLIRT